MKLNVLLLVLVNTMLKIYNSRRGIYSFRREEYLRQYHDEKEQYNITLQLISSWIFFLVASLVRKSFRMEMVEMLSDLNSPSPA
jgi:hypothetical protein